MDELAKAIQKKYIEDITSKYPLHRFVCLFILLISSYAVTNNTGQTFLSLIGELKVTYVFNFNSGLLSTITVKYFAMCFILVLLVRVLYSRFKDEAFKLLTKTSDFNKYINDIELSVTDKKSNNETLNYYLSKDVSVQLEKSRTIIRALHHYSEVILAVVISLLWGFENWSSIELSVFVACILLLVWNQWKSFNYYISTFLPYYITEKVLLGGSGVFGDK